MLVTNKDPTKWKQPILDHIDKIITGLKADEETKKRVMMKIRFGINYLLKNSSKKPQM